MEVQLESADGIYIGTIEHEGDPLEIDEVVEFESRKFKVISIWWGRRMIEASVSDL